MVKCISLTLVRFIQFSAVVFYSYTTFIYFGAVLLLPLAGIYHISNILNFLGVNAFIAVLLAIAMIVGVIYLGYKIPGFFLIIRDFGLSLIDLGFKQIKELGSVAEKIKNSPSTDGITSNQLSTPGP